MAFSGGVDSSLVAAVAARALGTARARGDRRLPRRRRRASSTAPRRVAAAVGIDHETIATDELAREGYRRNGRDRCYFCKTELYDALAAVAAPPRLRRAAVGRQRRRRGRLAPGPAGGRRARGSPSAARGRRGQGRRARARPASSACRARRSRPRPASPRAFPTGRRWIPRRSRASTAPSGRVRALGFPVLRVRHHGDPRAGRDRRRATWTRALEREAGRSSPPSARPATRTR